MKSKRNAEARSIKLNFEMNEDSQTKYNGSETKSQTKLKKSKTTKASHRVFMQENSPG